MVSQETCPYLLRLYCICCIISKLPFRMFLNFVTQVDIILPFSPSHRCAGYLFQRVGKIAATAVGGGFLLLQAREPHQCVCVASKVNYVLSLQE